MGSRTGRKGETACLARAVETPQGRRLPAWGFPYRKSDELKDRWFFEGEFLKCQGLFQPAPALLFFKKVICKQSVLMNTSE
jgi:hypothetical protein